MTVPRRLGVGIELHGETADVLQRRRVQVGDPAALRMPPHITLLLPTQVRDDRFVDVVLHLQQVADQARPFRIVLRGAATFRPVSPTVFVPLYEGAAECAELERVIRSGPLRRRLPFAYHPHVTVAHELPDDVLDAAMADLTEFAATIEVDAFGLYEPDDAGVWQLVQRFALGSKRD